MQGLWIIAKALKFSLKPFSVNFKGNVKIFQIHIIRGTYVHDRYVLGPANASTC